MIDDQSAQLGIMAPLDALKIAREKGLDLVEVSPTAQPPVCRIMDFGKYMYEQEKKEREARKNQRAGMLKEVRFSPVIGAHDLDVKVRHIEEFLKDHDKVRVTVFFRGRQMQHQDLGLQLLKGIQERLAPLASVEQQPMTDRNRLFMTLTPKH